MSTPIVISVIAKSGQAIRDLNSTASSASKVGNGFRKMAVPAGVALGAIALGAKQAIDSASDLGEEVSKSGVIFGNSAGTIRAFAKDAEQALGQSETAALKAASTFGQIGQKAGLSERESAKFAKTFTGLSSDLASFNNTTPEEAVEAIGAAMRGESEPIRKYGVLLDDATLRARALKLGLIASTKEALTPQQKAMAASREILAQTTKAQGDFARTSDSAANRQRILAAQTENLKAKLGQALLPAYEAALGIASKFAAAMAKHPKIVKAAVIAVAALAVAVLAVNAAMAINPAVLVAAAIAALAAALYVAYQRSAGFRSVIQAIGDVFTGYIIPAFVAVAGFVTGSLVPAFVAIAQEVASNLQPIFVQLAATFRNDLQPLLIKAAAKFREWWPTIKRVVLVLVDLYGRFLKLYASVLGKVIPVLIRFAAFLIKGVIISIVRSVAAVAAFIRVVIDVGRAVFNAGQWVADFAQRVRDRIAAALGFIRGLPGKVRDVFAKAGEFLLEAGRDIIRGLIEGIGDMVGDLVEKLEEITDLIPDLKGPPARDRRLLRPAGQSIMDGLVAGFTDRIPDVHRVLGRITDEIAGTNAEIVTALTVDRRGLQEAAVAASFGSTIQLEGAFTLTADQVSGLQRGREVRADLDAFRSAGGRRAG